MKVPVSRRLGAHPRRSLYVALLVLLLAGGVSPGANQGPAASQLFVTSVVPDAVGGTLTISGGSFGNRPFVTLDLVPLEVRASIDSLIVAVMPFAEIPHAEYLLTVSRGPSPAESASIQVTLETGPPSRVDPPNTSQPGANRRGSPEPSNSGAGASPMPIDANGPAARVGERVISIQDVDREWRRSDPLGYLQLIRQLYDARRQVLNAMVTDELLAREAAARGVSVEALLAEEVPKRVIPMPDSAVATLYSSLGANARGASLDQMRPALRAWLERRSEPELARMSFIEELKKVSMKAEILLDAPRVRVERAVQDVALGPPTAAVEIVAFGDFQSAAYARSSQAFSRIRDTFGDRVRFVFKNLPTLGPQSIAAAEAALCANAQDRFWAYHNTLVLGMPNAGRLVESANAAGLDRDAFTACVDSRKFQDAIRLSLDEAERYGVRASPSFLVNGRLAPPPPAFLAPYDYFKLLIEEELARLVTSRAR